MSMYFSRKMIRLILILAPASSVVAGLALDFLVSWSIVQQTIGEDEPQLKSEAPAVGKSPGKPGKPSKGRRSGTAGTPAFVRDMTEFYHDNLALRQVCCSPFVFGTCS
jgi:hypothetical protein